MHNYIALLLIVSSLALMTLVPGGPIENRDFSHISPLILSVFNLFLTTLGLGSLMLAYFAKLQYRWAVAGSLLAGLSYFVVYVLDLAHVFPVSPTPMPALLELIEILGTLLALALLVCSARVLLIPDSDTVAVGTMKPLSLPGHWQLILGMAGIVAVLIVIYATLAAMGQLPDSW